MLSLVFLALPPSTSSGLDEPLFSARDLTVGDEVVALTCGASSKDFILEVNGGGLVVSDFNLDGHLDLVTVNGSTIERVRAGEAALPSVPVSYTHLTLPTKRIV